MLILHTALYKFPMVHKKRTSLTIKNFFGYWSFLLADQFVINHHLINVLTMKYEVVCYSHLGANKLKLEIKNTVIEKKTYTEITNNYLKLLTLWLPEVIHM